MSLYLTTRQFKRIIHVLIICNNWFYLSLETLTSALLWFQLWFCHRFSDTALLWCTTEITAPVWSTGGSISFVCFSHRCLKKGSNVGPIINNISKTWCCLFISSTYSETLFVLCHQRVKECACKRLNINTQLELIPIQPFFGEFYNILLLLLIFILVLCMFSMIFLLHLKVPHCIKRGVQTSPLTILTSQSMPIQPSDWKTYIITTGTLFNRF